MSSKEGEVTKLLKEIYGEPAAPPRVELDFVDRRILEELLKNAEITTVELAKKLKVSQQKVSYRLKRLKDARLLKQTWDLDPDALGFEQSALLFINLKDLNPRRLRAIHSWAAKQPRVIHSASTSGKWDLVYLLASRDLEDMERLLVEFRTQFRDILAERELIPLTRTFKKGSFLELIKLLR